MTPRRSYQAKKDRKMIKKRGLRLGVLLVSVLLLLFGLMKLISSPVEATAEPKGKPVDISSTIKTDHRSKGKVVYLTFDDGPSELTGKFLDVLQEHDIKATFFMQGSNLKNKDLQHEVKRAVEEGNYVGGHSMTHQYKKLYEQGQFVSEMQETLSLIHELTGENPHLVRPPYGSAPGLQSKQLRDQIVDAGIKVWDWTIESNDWKLKNHPEQILENIKKATKTDTEVVLLHEKPQTLQVLPEIIAFYKEKGYEFAVYDESNHFHLNFQKDHRL